MILTLQSMYFSTFLQCIFLICFFSILTIGLCLLTQVQLTLSNLTTTLCDVLILNHD